MMHLDPKTVHNWRSEDDKGVLGKVPCRMVRVQSGSPMTFTHLPLLTRLDLESLRCLPDDSHHGKVAASRCGEHRSRSEGEFYARGVRVTSFMLWSFLRCCFKT
jgi:hypothetical protein